MTVAWGFLIAYTLIILFGEFLLLPKNEIDWCQAAQQGYANVVTSYPNPDTNNNPCYRERTIWLLGLSPFETDFSRRMITSVILGSIIGYERKAADRPAGVRTMALVCLGSCFFTMCGQHAFSGSPQAWDAARVSAAIPSGVGFLGSALIWKQSVGLNGNEKHEVHGLTTAASVWLSASVGIGAGGHLYVISVYAVILVVFVLRLGPRMYLTDDASMFETESEWDDTEDDAFLTPEEQQLLMEMEANSNVGQATGKKAAHETALASLSRRSADIPRTSSKITFHG